MCFQHRSEKVHEEIRKQHRRRLHVRVVRGLGYGLDEKAAEALSRWKFKPGTRNGKAVAVAATVEVKLRQIISSGQNVPNVPSRYLVALRKLKEEGGPSVSW